MSKRPLRVEDARGAPGTRNDPERLQKHFNKMLYKKTANHKPGFYSSVPKKGK